MKPPLSPAENARLEALRRYDILDSAPEASFDDLAQLAAQICGTPLSSITFIDHDRHWVKARVGAPQPENPREGSFGAHAILGDDLLIVPDACTDARFANHPLVTGKAGIRFYAGMPLITPDGHKIGTICVSDRAPRALDSVQQDALRRLARQVMALLNARLPRETGVQDDENRLKTSEMRYRRLFETARDGILILDAESGRIEDVNPFLCELLGHTPAEIVGKQLWEIGAFRDIASNQRAFEALQKRGFISYDDLPLQNRDGSSVSVEFVSNVYVSAGQKVIQCNIRDISERKNASVAVRESQIFLQSTLDALASHIAVLNETGEIIAVNKAWQQFSVENEGTPNCCGVGVNYLKVSDDSADFGANEAPLLAQGIRDVIAGKRAAFCLEYPCHCPQEQRWFSVCVTPFGGDGPTRVVVAHENITARKMAEDRTRESEANLAIAQQIAHMGSWELDLTNLEDVHTNPLRWSDEVFRIFGYAPGEIEVSNANFFRAVHPDDRAVLNRVMAEAILTDSTYDVEHRIVLPDGTHRYVQEQSELIRDENSGRPLKMIGTVQDVTERKAAQTQLHFQKTLLEAQTETSLDGILVVSDDGRILSYNGRFLQMWDIPPHIAANGEDAILLRAVVERVANPEQFLERVEHLYRHHDEHSYEELTLRDGRVFDRHSAPIISAEGTHYGRVWYFRDITERQQAEAALRESETRYRALAEAAPDDVFIVGRDGVMQYVNHHLAQRFGFSPEDVVGKTQIEIFPPEVARENREVINSVFESEKPFYVETRLHFHGQDIWQGVWLVPLRNGADEVVEVMGVARDISGQKHAEITLRESEIRYRALFESNPQPMWVYSLENLRFLAVNDAAVAHYGYSSAEFLAMTIEDIRPPEDVPALRSTVFSPSPNNPSPNNNGKKGTWRHRKKDDTLIEVELSTHELNFDDQKARLVLAHDITARRVAEKALQKANDELELHVMERTAELGAANESLHIENLQHQMTMGALRGAAEALRVAKEAADAANQGLRNEIAERQKAVEAQLESYALLHAVIEGTSDCIFVKDLQGRYLMINSAGARRRGKTVSQIIGKLDTDLFSPETARLLMEADQRILLSNTTQTFEETSVEDGVTRTHLVTKGPHRNPRGEVIGIVGIARDITARKQQEESLRIAKEEADSANAAKSEFLSRMSHELRTPLNAILGFGQILDRQEISPLARESVGYILKGGRHLLDLINEVLDIARVEAGRLELSLEPIALEDIVSEACALMRPLAGQREIRLSENLADLDHNYVLADRQRLKQVLINLIANGIKYNREGGEVEVFCAPHEEGWISIAVRDSGPGIAPHDLPKLFTPFERLDAGHSDIEGTGLGLVLCQRLVTAMRGTLGVESTLGQGTVVSVRLPRASSPQESWPDLAKNAQILGMGEETGHNYRVLCIEDNPSNLCLIEAILQSRPDITLLAAMQGGLGVDLARQHEPDLILLDLNLPDIHGREVLARLQQSALTRDIPVVVISADATPNQVERLLSAGAKNYLTKPLDISEFFEVLNEFLKPSAANAVVTNSTSQGNQEAV